MSKKLSVFFCFCLFLPSCFNFDAIPQDRPVKENSILLLNLKGIITGEFSEKFMKYIRKYADKDSIKGVLIRVNSPGGTVSASQEINAAIQEIKDFYKKPVFVSCGDVAASGAVYSIASADKIFVNEGTLFGSIGVLMQFHNYSELIQWAKIEAYHLKAGEFKDSGSPYRKMTLRERELFENLLENTLDQFKEAVAKGRKLEPKAVESFSDGRIFSGAEALEYGLADALGSFNQAVKAIGEASGLGSNPKLFDPGFKTPYEKFFENLSVRLLPAVNSFFSRLNSLEKLSGQPLYILPSYVSPQ